jgi:hypothetical protein
MGCARYAEHDGKTMCLACEETIAGCMDSAVAYDAEHRKYFPPEKPTRPEPHSLAPSGMCGPIMGRRR